MPRHGPFLVLIVLASIILAVPCAAGAQSMLLWAGAAGALFALGLFLFERREVS